MPEPILVVDGLTFRYRRQPEPALTDVSLEAWPGQVVLIAGPSGCGKSTLMRAVNGLIPHSYSGERRGQVRVAGLDIAATPLRDLAPLVGTVLQDPQRQIVASTILGELAFGPENLGLDRAEIGRRIGEVAEALDVEPLLARSPDELSGGERQRVAIGGILVLRPRLLLLDEPLANLDPLNASRLISVLRRLADGGTTVVIIEHRVEDVLPLRPDHVLYLEEGRRRYLGDVPGFLRVAEPASVKLPFDALVARARTEAAGGDFGGSGVARQPGDPRLEFRDVSAGYDGQVVLRELSATMRSFETVAVLGPNGSGKSTLFKTAMNLVRPLSGEVLVDGTSTARRSTAELARRLGFVFQAPSQMLFERSVREELLFGPRNLGQDPSGLEELLSDVVSRVGLAEIPDLESRPPRTLSFGQQKRLAIAVALCLEPATLLLDEPSAGQDHRAATRFMREVRSIAGLDSVYLVTHDVDLALSQADRLLLLRDGQIVGDGAPLEVIADRSRWETCNLHVTSLMTANQRWARETGRFLDGPTLAGWIARHERESSGELGGQRRTTPP